MDTKEWKRRNKEKVREHGRKYYAKNKDRLLANSKKYQSLPRGRAGKLVSSAKKRAEKYGVGFDLTREWAQRILEAGVCQITGLEFDMVRTGSGCRNPMSPSIDRVKAGGDYTQDNCRVILTGLNFALNEWGEKTYREIAEAYLHVST